MPDTGRFLMKRANCVRLPVTKKEMKSQKMFNIRLKMTEKICLNASESELLADGEDLLFVEISMRDKDGYPVQNANNRVWIEAEGAGVLVGTDNGDSTDTEQYTSGSRRLFSGKLLAVFKTKDKAGDLKIPCQQCRNENKRTRSFR